MFICLIAMSQIMLYFLHSILALCFYIDVVLTLSTTIYDKITKMLSASYECHKVMICFINSLKSGEAFTPELGEDWLTLYMINFSEGTKTFIHILCYSPTLTWHRWLESFLKKAKNLPLHSQYHEYWCPGDARRQGISNRINSAPAR